MKKPLNFWENSWKIPDQHRDNFWNILRNLSKITSNEYPETLGDGVWVSWGRLLHHFSVQRPSRQKKRRKLTWRTLPPGSKLGLKIFTFPEKKQYKAWKNELPDTVWKKDHVLKGSQLQKWRPLYHFPLFMRCPDLHNSPKPLYYRLKSTVPLFHRKPLTCQKSANNYSPKGDQASNKWF